MMNPECIIPSKLSQSQDKYSVCHLHERSTIDKVMEAESRPMDVRRKRRGRRGVCNQGV